MLVVAVITTTTAQSTCSTRHCARNLTCSISLNTLIIPSAKTVMSSEAHGANSSLLYEAFSDCPTQNFKHSHHHPHLHSPLPCYTLLHCICHRLYSLCYTFIHHLLVFKAHEIMDFCVLLPATCPLPRAGTQNALNKDLWNE